MRAMVMNGPRQAEVTSVPTPEPGPGEVLVKVAYCGICGTDLRAYNQWGAMPSHWGATNILGHEFSGEVAAVGEGVDGSLVGQPVAVRPAGYCGECYWCQRGRFPQCLNRFKTVLGIGKPGGMAEYVRMPAHMARPVPAGADIRKIALAEPLAVAIKGVRNGEIGVGEDVLIFGAGPIGLLLLQVVRRAGASRITVVEPMEGRRRLAAQLGADITIDPTGVDDITSLLPSYDLGGPDVVFECSGVAAANQQALDVVRRSGRVVLVGGIPAPVQISLYKGALIRVSIASDYADFEDAKDMILSGHVDVEPMISAIVPLEEAPRGFEMLNEDRNHIKVLIQP